MNFQVFFLLLSPVFQALNIHCSFTWKRTNGADELFFTQSNFYYEEVPGEKKTPRKIRFCRTIYTMDAVY